MKVSEASTTFLDLQITERSFMNMCPFHTCSQYVLGTYHVVVDSISIAGLFINNDKSPTTFNVEGKNWSSLTPIV